MMMMMLPSAWIYSCIVSFLFVFNLYLLVPIHVRTHLPRNHPTHIRWRLVSVLSTCLIAIGLQSLFFPHASYFFMYPSSVTKKTSFLVSPSSSSSRQCLFHIMILYLGPMLVSCWKIHCNFSYHKSNSISRTIGSNHSSIRPVTWTWMIRIKLNLVLTYTSHWISSLNDKMIIDPFLFNPNNNPWCGIRDLIIAPLAEEVVFRACIVPPFVDALMIQFNHDKKEHHHHHESIRSSNNMIIRHTCFITPLFFGIAHVHHAITKYYTLQKQLLQQPMTATTRRSSSSMNHDSNHHSLLIKRIVMETLFQFMYTYLFGIYTCYVYCCTYSLFHVWFIHSFCNYMGLPDISWFFLVETNPPPYNNNDNSNSISSSSTSRRRRRRIISMKMILGSFYILGMIGFYYGFTHKGNDYFFPSTYYLMDAL